MMRIKPGVSVRALRPQLLLAVLAADRLMAAMSVDLVITSGDEGQHSRGSRHYSGLALDFRSRDLVDHETKLGVANALRECLGDEYDVLLEETHIHVEYDPKGPR